MPYPGTTITLRAKESCTATSSGVVARTVLPSSARAAPAAVWTWPNAPKRTFATERFIAFAMRRVRSVPAAPTSIPDTMRTVESSTNPVAEAASPVNAFNSEMTTGMSAPPIGRTNMTPKSSASPIRAMSTHSPSTPAIAATPRAAAPSRTRMLTTFCPGKTIGRPLMSSWSFPYAIAEPANEIDPISAESTTETVSSPAGSATLCHSASATSAAAPPPTPLKIATICGIAVMRTVRAPTRPTTVPTTSPATIRPQFPMPSSRSVVAIATSIPAPPIQFPLRACFGDERNLRATMKQTIVTR